MPGPYGAAQPIVDSIKPPDWLLKMLGLGPTPPPPSAAPASPLPPAWEKANQDSIQQQMGGVKQQAPPEPPRRRMVAAPPKDFSPDPVKDPYGYGPNNSRLIQLNSNANLSGIRGYPSDQEYMETVGKAGLERQRNRMQAPVWAQEQRDEHVPWAPKEEMSPWGTPYENTSPRRKMPQGK